VIVVVGIARFYLAERWLGKKVEEADGRLKIEHAAQGRACKRSG